MKVSKATKYSLYIVGFSLVTILVIIFVQRYSIYQRDLNTSYQKLDHLIQQQQASVKTAVDKKDWNSIKNALRQTSNILDACYEGKETGVGMFVLDNELQLTVKEALGAIENFQNEISSRTMQGTLDDSNNWMQTSSESIMMRSTQIREHIHANISESTRFVNTLSWYSVVLLIMGFTVVCLFIIRFMRRTQQYLLDSEKNLVRENVRVDSLSKFIESVSKGDYNIKLEEGSKEDHLTDMLISMRDTLKGNAETERRRNWSTSGLAKIGEILRSSSESTTVLYDRIIQFVVKYTNSCQGGLFILNDDDESNRYLELSACYAFERKKFIQKNIDLGQGLVGQCFLEGERIYLLEVPDEYMNITSGLGRENPRAILLIPMKVNDEVFGVIELATFSTYQEFEILMVEEFAESIASTISTVKTNERTRILLEQTQQQAEEMRSQEEEMRQNMEELSATQEEMGRKEKEYILRIEELEGKLKGQEADTLK